MCRSPAARASCRYRSDTIISPPHFRYGENILFVMRSCFTSSSAFDVLERATRIFRVFAPVFQRIDNEGGHGSTQQAPMQCFRALLKCALASLWRLQQVQLAHADFKTGSAANASFADSHNSPHHASSESAGNGRASKRMRMYDSGPSWGGDRACIPDSCIHGVVWGNIQQQPWESVHWAWVSVH